MFIVRVCVLNKVKNKNAEVFNLISGISKTIYLVQHQSSERKCRLNESVCNSNQKKNLGDGRCECKELDGWDSRKNYLKWNPITCGCECNKTYKIDEDVNTKNCSGKKCLFGKLVLTCKVEILKTTETLFDDKRVTLAKSN